MVSVADRIRRGAPVAFALSVLSVAAIVAYVGTRGDADVIGTLRGLPLWTVPAALAMHVGAHLAWAARLSLLSTVLKQPVPARPAWSTITSGVFGGALSPGRIGGEAVKLAILMRRGQRAAVASRLLLADRAFDLLFFIVLGGVAIILLPPVFGAEGAAARTLAVLGTAVLLAFMVTVAAALAFPRATTRAMGPLLRLAARIGRRDPDSLPVRAVAFLEEVRSGLLAVATRRPAAAFAALLLTCLNWVVEYGAIWVLLIAFGFPVPYVYVFAVGGVLTLVSNIPVTPGGSGVAEAAGLALLLPLAPGVSPLVVVAWRGVTYYYDVIAGGLVAAVTLPRRRGAPVGTQSL